jgi:hypothetical protein
MFCFQHSRLTTSGVLFVTFLIPRSTMMGSPKRPESDKEESTRQCRSSHDNNPRPMLVKKDSVELGSEARLAMNKCAVYRIL